MRLELSLPLFASLALSACMAKTEDIGAPPAPDGGTPPVNGDGGISMIPDGSVEPGFLASDKANIKPRDGARLENDLAQWLGLPAARVCEELGQYPCVGLVHNVTLGGVDAYEYGLNEPLPNSSVTSPMALERVVLHACRERVTDDFAGTDPLLYGSIGVQADGTLLDVEAPAVAAAVDRLYRRALLRPATEAEIAHHKQLYRDILADGAPNAARDWAILSCFATLTSVEAFFY